MRNRLTALTECTTHGHVEDIEHRLVPWSIELEVEEEPGVTRWHLSSDVETQAEMERHLRSAVRRSLGHDCVRIPEDAPRGDRRNYVA